MRITFLAIEIMVTSFVCATLLLPALNGDAQPLRNAAAIVQRL